MHFAGLRRPARARRAYASAIDRGFVSITMTGAPTPAEIERDVRRVVASAAID